MQAQSTVKVAAPTTSNKKVVKPRSNDRLRRLTQIVKEMAEAEAEIERLDSLATAVAK